MTTGYQKAGTDLDALFAARVSAAAANVNFKSNGGVDLSQRFEPRGSTTPIADTGLKSASIDLAQIFKSIAYTPVALTMTAGTFFETTPGRTHNGYAVAAFVTGAGVIGSVSSAAVGANTLQALLWNDDDILKIAFSAGSAPADADSTWQSVDVTGTYPGPFTGTRSVARTSGSSAVNGTRRTWTFTPGILQFAAGNIYSVTFNRV